MNLKIIKHEWKVWTTTANNERTAAGEMRSLDPIAAAMRRGNRHEDVIFPVVDIISNWPNNHLFRYPSIFITACYQTHKITEEPTSTQIFFWGHCMPILHNTALLTYLLLTITTTTTTTTITTTTMTTTITEPHPNLMRVIMRI